MRNRSVVLGAADQVRIDQLLDELEIGDAPHGKPWQVDYVNTLRIGPRQ